MTDYIEIGPSPCEEDCVQVGTEDYLARGRAECRRFIDLIRQECGEEPPGAVLTIKNNPHDFGTYSEVICRYNDSNEEAMDYAFFVESNAPTKWDGTGGNRWKAEAEPQLSPLEAYRLQEADMDRPAQNLNCFVSQEDFSS
jgi:hypothetical protein